MKRFANFVGTSTSVARRAARSANALLKAPRSQSDRASAGGSAARTCRSDEASLSDDGERFR